MMLAAEEDITYMDKIAHMFDWAMDPQLYSSLLIMAVLLILGAIVGVKARIAYKKKDYLKRPKGLLFFAEWYEEMCEGFVKGDMGAASEGWAGYFWTLFAYLFLAFNWSLLGLPSVIDWLAGPLSLSLVMFLLIQITAIRYQKWGYFHRYIDPFPLFLPINLLTMWSPIISTTMRLFGNCLAGSIIIGLIQWALSNASVAFFGLFGVSSQLGASAYWNAFPGWTGIFFAPIPMGVLNIYFSLFSGFVQTLVFGSLTALWIAQEIPSVSPALSEAPHAALKAAGE